MTAEPPAAGSAPTTDIRRLAIEQLSQLLPIASTILERVMLTAVFYRCWGADLFAGWSVLVSLAGLVSLGEFGFAMYFSNGVALAVQRGDQAQAIRMFRNGFTILLLAAVIGWAAVLGGAYAFLATGSGGAPLALDRSMLIVAALALTAVIRLPMAVIYALYRAHLRFAYFTLASSSADILRVVATTVAVLTLSAGPLTAAVVALLATAALQLGYFIWDTRRHHPDFAVRLRWPSRAEGRDIGRISFAYFAQTLSNILITSLPVLLLERQSVPAVLLAAFVLVRTLMGLPRMLLQTVGVVIGYECSRHLAQKDGDQAMRVIRESARVIAVASGLLTGGLIAVGAPLTALWVGNPHAFVPDYAAAAAIPLALAAASIISHNILITANIAYLAAAGRLLQLGLTVLLFFVLQLPDAGLRMFVAMGAAELLGYALFSYIALYRRAPAANIAFHLWIIVQSLVTCAASWAAITLFARQVAPHLARGEIAQLAFAALFCSTSFLLLGLSRRQRRLLFSLSLRRA